MCTMGAIRPFKDGGSFLDDDTPFPSKMVKLLASKLSIKVGGDFPNRVFLKNPLDLWVKLLDFKNAVVFFWCFPETPIGSMHFFKGSGMTLSVQSFNHQSSH